ncbi:unnamed protein product [Phytomonas sp. Hart1]|nr:unnamed protein product [Phytomonas sp. Hart1]|eukprot:CCW70596.1 unnamed protein product [Phytomonas sp. isolate Hart1]
MSSWQTLSFEQATNYSVLANIFHTQTAAAISRHLNDFLPFKGEFPLYFARISPSGHDPKLEVVWNVYLRAHNPNRAMFVVAIVYSKEFPRNDVEAYLRVPDPSKMYVKYPNPLLDRNGRIQLNAAQLLSLERHPYSIRSILIVLSRQFERNFPYEYIPVPGASNFPDTHPFAPLAPNNKTPESFTGIQNEKRLEDIAEKVLIDINQKASQYINTRKQSIQYLKTLRAQNERLEKAKADLLNHKQMLSEYLPNVGNVRTLIQQLKGREDTIEEHANSLIAGDTLQAKALELVVDSLALDDMMGLLDDALKSEKLSCEEYVKLITDLGREQFFARFVYQKIQPQLTTTQSTSAFSSNSKMPGHSTGPNLPHEIAPSIPKRLSPEDVLKREFPKADMGIIHDVLSNLNNDIGAASAQLKVMFP